MRKFIWFLMAFLGVVFVYGCSSVGVARLPSAETLFISQASEDAFVCRGDLKYPYQPIGFVEISSMQCAPCAGDLKGVYKSLEKSMSEQLVQKAKKEMGADAVIDLKWSATSSFRRAIMSGYPCAALGSYIQNFNMITLRGLAVKTK